MDRINLLLDKESIEYLKSLPGTFSEHIRIATWEYIKRVKALNVSASQSKRKEEKNG